MEEKLKKSILRKLKIIKIKPTYYRISELILLAKELSTLKNIDFKTEWHSNISSKIELNNFYNSILEILNEDRKLSVSIKTHKKEEDKLYAINIKDYLPTDIYNIVIKGTKDNEIKISNKYIDDNVDDNDIDNVDIDNVDTVENIEIIGENIIGENIVKEIIDIEEEDGYSLYEEDSNDEESEFSD